jgi:hypothetical protein
MTTRMSEMRNIGYHLFFALAIVGAIGCGGSNASQSEEPVADEPAPADDTANDTPASDTDEPVQAVLDGPGCALSDGSSAEEGASAPLDCNTCTCESGSGGLGWSCTEEGCPEDN